MRSTITALGLVLIFAAAFLFVVRNDASPAAGEPVRDSKAGAVRYRIDPGQSKFMVHAFRGGLAWFKGHDHFLAVRDFGGTAQLDLDAVNPASLQLTVRADSLEETGADFTAEQKEVIKKELHELVLETAKYPETSFNSTEVKGGIKNGHFEIEIGGDITLHGVTRPITIPAKVTVDGDTLRATGEFKLDRKKFNVNATSAFHGLVRVKHGLKFTFDIVARRE